MYSLKEIIKAQQDLDLDNFSKKIVNIENCFIEFTCIKRKDIKLLFLPIDEVFKRFNDPVEYQNFKNLYNIIFLAVYQQEKQFIERKINLKKFFKELELMHKNFLSRLEDLKKFQIEVFKLPEVLKLQEKFYNEVLKLQEKVQFEPFEFNELKIKIYQKFYDDIVDKIKVFEKILKIDLTSHLNYLGLNQNIIQQKYDKDFVFKIPATKKRIMPIIEKQVYKNFCKNQKNFVNDLENVLTAVVNLYNKLEQIKNQKTQEILKGRKQIGLTTSYWESEQEYIDQFEHWKNDFVIDKFLGIAGQYIDWKYPVAYIDPNAGELTRHIISGDPFYVIDDRYKPYENILKSLPIESHKKILYYNKKTAHEYLEKSSIGFCVSWNNFPFMTQGKIYKEFELVGSLLQPGGYFIFNYADAHSVFGAEFVETYTVPICWRERIDRYAREFDLIEIDTKCYENYPFTFAIYQKIGKLTKINLINKLGLVLPDQKYLEQKRSIEIDEGLKVRASRSKLEQDLKRLLERDQLLRDLDKQRQLGKENVIEIKLKNAINHLNSMIATYDDYTHPSVLEGLLHVSKLTYSLGRVKDSKNLIKRVERDIEKMSADNFIARKYREWQDFLNNT